MLYSNADVSRSLPERRAFTVATGPLANTPLAPSSSSAFSPHPHPRFKPPALAFPCEESFSALFDSRAFLQKATPSCASSPGVATP
eukprot:4059987-Pleurochrysis_carterae.AAC.1